MNYTNIINKINQAINNLDKDNFISNFEKIINDLKYIYIELDDEIKELSDVEQFEHGIEFETKVMEYFAKLTKLYIKLNHNIDLEIECKNEYSLSMANGSYDSEQDKIKYSYFGMMLGKENKTSYLSTFMHESRHKMQKDIYKETDIEKIINFQGNAILLLKDKIYESLQQKNNRKFYLDNYDSLYTETDAEKFSLEHVRDLVLDLYAYYLMCTDKTPKDIDDFLIKKILEIHNKIYQERLAIDSKNQPKGRLRKSIIEEMSGKKQITSTYKVEGVEVDKMIELDKTIKSHPEFSEKMPLLKLLFNGDIPKTYNEIIKDRQNLLEKYPQHKEKINELYNNIIMTDPILYLTDLVVKNKKAQVIEFLNIHPTIFDVYPEEIQYICSLSNNEEIITILTSNNNKQK